LGEKKIILLFSSMAWNPKKPEIAAIDVGGYWGVVSDIADAKSDAKNVSKSDVVKKSKPDHEDEDDDVLNDDEVNFVPTLFIESLLQLGRLLKAFALRVERVISIITFLSA
jgi:hypothetical protein